MINYGTDVKAALRAELERQGMSQSDIARELGWAQQEVNRLLNPAKGARLASIEPMMDHLGLVVAHPTARPARS